MKEYVAVHSNAAAAAGKGKGKAAKKKGVTLHLDMFQELQVRPLVFGLCCEHHTDAAGLTILTHQDPAWGFALSF
jgi:hypothetical protein